ncbi:MAG: SH3 domain-containing protein [Tahibacter sp.]
MKRLDRLRIAFHCLLAASATSFAPIVASEVSPTPVVTSAVPGVSDAQLSADFWIARLAQPDAVVLQRDAIDAQNRRLEAQDPTLYDLRALPAELSRAQVTTWLRSLSEAPSTPLFDVNGKPVSQRVLRAIVSNANVGKIPLSRAARYGLVVRRANLRTFPTELRVFHSVGDTDIDRFQESALFPGDPVVIAHESRDRRWWFVVSPRYAAWIAQESVATGPRESVLAYGDATPSRVVTGATVHTVYTRENPALSQLPLDMGVRLPLHAASPLELVNGQHPYAAHVIELPQRAPDGTLSIAPALLQKNADTASDYLPLTRANLLRQAFKFLGERYGWGHSYDARDCSGFVSDVYRSMGVAMPRNTRDQSVSPALPKRQFDSADDRATRMSAVRATEIGDLVYIPGHVMMVIGQLDGEPWVIHDTTGISYRDAGGALRRITLNGVSVTPLLPLQFSESELYLDRITSIVRIRPDSKEASAHP